MFRQSEYGVARFAGFLACIFFVLYPLYWKLFASTPVLEVLAHRIIWSVPFLLLAAFVADEMPNVRAIVHDRPKLFIIASAAACISINWGVYIWAVNIGRVVDASIGYFLAPLFQILIGVFVFQDRLSVPRIIAVSLATLGVSLQTAFTGVLPYAGIAIGLSVAMYTTIRKYAPVSALTGLVWESLLLLPVALAGEIYYWMTGTGRFMTSFYYTCLLMLSGLVSAGPYLLYVFAARKLPLTTLGIMFFTVPLGLFLLGAFYYREIKQPWEYLVFIIVITAVALYLLCDRLPSLKSPVPPPDNR